jgi:hypothetical protein
MTLTSPTAPKPAMSSAAALQRSLCREFGDFWFRARTGSLRRSRKPRPEPLHVVAPTPSAWFAQHQDRWLAHVG